MRVPGVFSPLTVVIPLLVAQVSAQQSTPPLATGNGGWEGAFQQAVALTSRMNLTEKASMVTGSLLGGDGCVGNIVAIPRLGFNGYCLQDGPLAIRMADLASVFPAGVTVAATWDEGLMYARGVALGEEFRGKGAHVMLGPVAGPLGRHALGGRNWEGFSPDPYLTGVAMRQTITGAQSVGVQACAKHYIGNEQETQRNPTISSNGTEIPSISANIDDRTLHELYLWPFADAVRAGVSSVMCSYNRVNQTYACQDPHILNEVLKTELGFQGYVVSDWFATHSGLPSILAGLDMNQPGSLSAATVFGSESYFGGNITTLVRNGSLSETRLDDMIHRILTPYFHLGQNSSYPTVDPTSFEVEAVTYGIDLSSVGLTQPNATARDVRDSHAGLIRGVANAGTVLLKNEGKILPLKAPKVLGVFGNDAPDVTGGLYLGDPFATFEGTLITGGGSGSARATYVVPPLQALKFRTEADGTRLQYDTNNTALAGGDFKGIYPKPDVCLVFLKTFATEGVDRTEYEADWDSTQVVDSVADYCPNTVVITHSDGINTMPWADHPNVKAILAAYYPGQESGNSIVDVLYGIANPSAKLPYTIPMNGNDTAAPIVRSPGPYGWQANFTEGLLIDYRHYDAFNITPRYEFGFGLSYTTFALTSPLAISKLFDDISATPQRQATMPGGNPDLYTLVATVCTSVKNTGDVAGATVVQLYASTSSTTRVLRGFRKIYLQPGETQDVCFELTRKDLSYWNVQMQDWVVSPGTINLSVGFSSRDLVRKGTLSLL